MNENKYYEFSWESFPPRTFYREIINAIGIDKLTELQYKEFKSCLIEILKSVGGIPITVRKYNVPERLSISRGLLNDAISATYKFRRKVPKVKLKRTGTYYIPTLSNEDKDALLKKDSLEAKIKRKIASTDFKHLISLLKTIRKKVVRIYRKNDFHFGRRTFLNSSIEAKMDSDFTDLLIGPSYYYHLPSFFKNAKKRIRIAMFHIAMTGKHHPTTKLINAVIRAKKRGVKIKVLLDKDRSGDPYNSTIINSRVKSVLQAHGVQVRFDSPNRLLHSKFIIIDDTVIIGSHNWSAGSYFNYDDMSVRIGSRRYASDMIKRFNKLWRRPV